MLVKQLGRFGRVLSVQSVWSQRCKNSCPLPQNQLARPDRRVASAVHEKQSPDKPLWLQEGVHRGEVRSEVVPEELNESLTNKFDEIVDELIETKIEAVESMSLTQKSQSARAEL